MQKRPQRPSAKNRKTEAGKRKALVWFAFLAVIVIVILLIKIDVIPMFSQETVDYLAAKKQFADQLSRALSSDQDKFRIAAINGPQYEPGYVLDADNPLDLLTDKCLLDRSVLVTSKWTPLPEVAFRNDIAANLKTSKIIEQFSKDIADLGGKIKKSQRGIYKLTEIHQVLAPSIAFYKALAHEQCQEVIDGRDVVIVRGQILARETMSTSRELGTDVEARMIGAGKFLLRVNHRGDFVIEDKEPIPRFHIISTYAGTSRGSIRELLQAPTAELIEKLESIGTQ